VGLLFGDVGVYKLPLGLFLMRQQVLLSSEVLRHISRWSPVLKKTQPWLRNPVLLVFQETKTRQSVVNAGVNSCRK